MAGRTDMQRQNPDIHRLLGVLAVILILACASFARNRVWDSKLSLWSDVAEKSGGKSRAHNNLGNCYMLLERPFKAVEEYKAAIALDADNIEAYYNLAMNLEKVGLPGEAAAYYDHFCRKAPPAYQQQKESSCEIAKALFLRTGVVAGKASGRNK
jgi:tetratricopeptide (TPR) repeat protein